MAVTRSSHISTFVAVPHVVHPVEDDLVALVHGQRGLLVVTTTDEVHERFSAYLDALVVVREVDLEAIDAIVHLVAVD